MEFTLQVIDAARSFAEKPGSTFADHALVLGALCLGEHDYLHAIGDHIAQDFLGQERGLVEKAEGNENKARKRRPLELNQGDKDLNGEDEERNYHDRPGDHEDDDLNEIFKAGDIAHQLAGGFEDRLAGVETDLRDAARVEKIGGRKAGAGGLQAESGKAVEGDFGKLVEIADEEGEEVDIERLLDEARDDVLLARERPKEAGERDIERQESDIAAEEAKS